MVVDVPPAIQNLLDELNSYEWRYKPMKPSLNRGVLYRGNQGLFAMRPAIVTATVDTLEPEGVSTGMVPDLDSDMHVHLFVMTPSVQGHFSEFNVPFGEPGEDGKIPPGTWCWPKIVKHES